MTIIHDAQTTPHHYRPSWLHMGDCHICGHVAGSPLHIPADAFRVVMAQGDLWQHTTHLGGSPKIRPLQPLKTVKSR
jgi:hypothetical protein